MTAMIGRFLVTFALNSNYQLTTEIMPTQLRGQGFALSNAIAQLANMVSPYVIYSVRWKRSIKNQLVFKDMNFSEQVLAPASLLHFGRGRHLCGLHHHKPSRDLQREAARDARGGGELWSEPALLLGPISRKEEEAENRGK
jgi:hypothetical protein